MRNDNINYKIWCLKVNGIIHKIMRKKIKITYDLSKLYKNNYHAYTAAIYNIIESDEYKNNKVYEDFVIPYENKIVIVKI